jgi:hypothetical protein
MPLQIALRTMVVKIEAILSVVIPYNVQLPRMAISPDGSDSDELVSWSIIWAWWKKGWGRSPIDRFQWYSWTKGYIWDRITAGDD